MSGAPAVPRFLVVRLSALGDVSLASAVVEALHVKGAVVLATRAEFAELYRRDPRLTDLVAVDPGDLSRARRRIVALAPDVVLDLQGTARSRRLLGGLPIPPSHVVRKDGLARRLAVLGRRGWKPTPVFRRFLDVAARALGESVSATPALDVPPEATARAMATLRPDLGWIGMAPGSAWRNKRWPLDRFRELAGEILRDRARGVAVFVGPGESDIGATFATAGPRDRIEILDLPLSLLPAHLERIDLLVTGDSGPLHVAEAVGTPVVALFGPTTEHFGFWPFLPASRVIERSLWCRPCHVHGGNRCPLGHHRCMKDISVLHVIEGIGSALSARETAVWSGARQEERE